MGLALFHILVVRYKDKKSLLHNNSWIFKEERIDYSYGEQINIVTLKQMHGYNNYIISNNYKVGAIIIIVSYLLLSLRRYSCTVQTLER